MFGGYAARKYNFIDIVRSMFSEQGKMKGEWTKIGINVLHLLNQGFFDTSYKRYWVSPEEFFDCTEEELFCMLDLIKIRYNKKLCIELADLLKKTDNIKIKIREVHKFYTELSTILQQFHVVQASAFKGTGQGVVRDGFWDTQRTFIDFLLDQSLFTLTPKTTQALIICQKGFFIYDYISNKNYAAAADKCYTDHPRIDEQNSQNII